MKLKIYVIKKKQLIWAAIILLIIIIGALLLINFRSKSTVKSISASRTFGDFDIDNDGKSDAVVVKPDEKTLKYSIDILTNSGKAFSLEPDPSIKSLGSYSDWWPINIMVKDINNDGYKELVIQSSDSNGPILHIFKYLNGNIERIASGRYSFFGTLKIPSEKSGIVVLGAKRNDMLNLTFLGTNHGKLYPYTPPTAMTLGKETLNSLISFIEKKDVEAFNINMDSKMASVISKGTFLDGSLEDIKYSSYNIPTECTYILRTASKNNDIMIPVVYKIKLDLTKYDNKEPEYRISNVLVVK